MSAFCSDTPERADPALVAGWLAARSIARGLPAPVAIPGGWMVETGGEVEQRRYVFPQPSLEIERLARQIDRPGIYLKCCCDDAVLAALLSDGWLLDAPSWMMTGPDPAAVVRLPVGYRSAVLRSEGVVDARILTDRGELAARGFAAAAHGVFVYDRIVTEPAHLRRGLGSAIMALLGMERAAASHPVLIATAAGRALYESLGWSVHAPYASAVRSS